MLKIRALTIVNKNRIKFQEKHGGPLLEKHVQNTPSNAVFKTCENSILNKSPFHLRKTAHNHDLWHIHPRFQANIYVFLVLAIFQ